VGAVLEGLSAHGLVIELKGEGSGTVHLVNSIQFPTKAGTSPDGSRTVHKAK